MSTPAQIRTVADVRPGDQILVGPQTGWQTVSKTLRYDNEPGHVTICYFLHGEHAYSRGPEYKPRLVERAMAAVREHDPIAVRPGTAADAAALQGELEEGDQLRTDEAARRSRQRRGRR